MKSLCDDFHIGQPDSMHIQNIVENAAARAHFGQGVL